jgi:hypothetical protein
MDDIIREKNGQPIWWTDRKGVTHICEGAYVTRQEFLLWTLCGRDVPANSARTAGDQDHVTCSGCLLAKKTGNDNEP